MAKTKISEWSTTPASNTDIDGINIAEGCAPSGINDAIRDLMAQVRSWQSGASGDPFNGPMNGTIGATTAYSGAFTTLSASGTTTLSGLTASTALALDASKNVVSVANTGSGSNVLATSPTLVTPALGTPSSATLTNATGLPISTGVSGLGTGVATALAVNVGSAGAPVVNGGALGTPSSGTVTNLTGTASININGTVGATTANTGNFTTLTTSSTVTLNGGTANGVTYLNGSKVLTSGSALTFDGTTLGVNNGVTGGTSVLLTGTYAGAGTVAFMNFQRVGGAVAGTLGYDDSINSIRFGTTTNHSLVFLQNNAEAMRLTSTSLYTASGINVGIGTSSPQKKLVVSNAGAVGMEWSPTDYTGNMRQLAYNRSTSAYVALRTEASQHEWYIGGSESMRLDSAGNLGLGVTPSGWATFTAQQIGPAGGMSLWAGADNVNIGANVYYNAGYKRVGAYAASSYQQGAGAHYWNTASASTAGSAISFTTAMTLDASGNLGVGTTSPGAKVDASGTYRLQLRTDDAVPELRSITANGAAFKELGINGLDLRFNTSNTERARIDSSGNLLVGTTSVLNGGKFSLYQTNNSFAAVVQNTSSAVSGAYGIQVNLTQDPNSTDSFFYKGTGNATDRFYVRANGGIGNYQANNVNLSDRREKTNFAPATSYLDKICAIPVQTFNFIDQAETDVGLTLGVVAQDVQAVAPELVTESNWGTEEEPKMRLSIYQTDLQYALMKCIQEQQAIIESLKARLDAANL